jgi:hypothetical protein
VKFIDPPGPQIGRPRKYLTEDVRAALDAQPGEWALLIESASDSVRASVHVACRRDGNYETTTRRLPDKTFDIYVRRIKEDQ